MPKTPFPTPRLPYKWFKDFTKRNVPEAARPFPLTTEMVAKELGIASRTLYRWIGTGRLRAPDPGALKDCGITYRLWLDEDIERARKLVGKLKPGRPKATKSKRKEGKKRANHKSNRTGKRK
jgi:excisionase family DNA binding protein